MTQRREFLTAAAAGSAMLAVPGLAAATQGVSKTEIVIGSLLDLSGPAVTLGKGIQNGMIMRAEQINAAGGIHGRKLKVAIEDSGYDPKKAVLGAQKLLSQDKIFAMIGSIGTPVSLPTIPLCIERNVPHLFPVTAHKGNYEPFHKLKFASFVPYQYAVELGLKELLRSKGYKRVGILYQDDEFGMEVLRGAEKALGDAKMTLVEKTTYKRGATEFGSQMQKLRASNPDLIVLGTIVRETIGAMAAGRQLGITADFFGSSAAYMPAVAKAGGKAVDGLIATSETPTPYRDDPKNSKLLNDWMDQYQARFKEEADLWSVAGWHLVDMFVKAAEKAGPNLSSDSFVQALETMVYPRSFLGTPEYGWSPTVRQGNMQTRLQQIRSGRWVTISDFLKA
ncbi:MAG TPA: ABC transporter substrate-binding protein [Quisquiliibacterium sp.]|nr:ABC transporter substrate-binding protein [Quisquiliibacterium sp.]